MTSSQHACFDTVHDMLDVALAAALCSSPAHDAPSMLFSPVSSVNRCMVMCKQHVMSKTYRQSHRNNNQIFTNTAVCLKHVTKP